MPTPKPASSAFKILAACLGSLLTACHSVWSVTEFVQVVNAEMAGVAADAPVFTDYSPAGTSTWSPESSSLDLSGVAWDSNRAGTLITPQHIVFAKHFPRSAGSQIVFTDASGMPVTRTISATMDAIDDTVVGVLNEPVPATVQSYSLLASLPDPASELTGMQVLVTDGSRRFRVYGSGLGNELAIGNGPALFYTGGAPLVAGDSGNPAFILFNGELVLLSTHTDFEPDGGFGGYLSSTGYIAALEQSIDLLSGEDAYDLDFVQPVPEPGAGALLAGLAAVGAALRRRLGRIR